ncbi:hypothetical protein QBC39DRAFT_360156 [Podospora conica]|nr:hypothetical protein QBC39DRAFT_360156 [Schizothecium conicum]
MLRNWQRHLHLPTEVQSNDRIGSSSGHDHDAVPLGCEHDAASRTCIASMKPIWVQGDRRTNNIKPTMARLAAAYHTSRLREWEAGDLRLNTAVTLSRGTAVVLAGRERLCNVGALDESAVSPATLGTEWASCRKKEAGGWEAMRQETKRKTGSRSRRAGRWLVCDVSARSPPCSVARQIAVVLWPDGESNVGRIACSSRQLGG